MKFRLGRPSIGENFEPEVEGWKSIREPHPIWLQVMVLPLMVLSVGWTAAAFYLLGVAFRPPTIVGLAVLIVILIPLHELLHAVITPQYGLSDETHIGFWPKTLLFYAVYDGEMTRNRFLLVFITPTLVLTILPLIIAAVAGTIPNFLMNVALLNALLNGGDLLGMLFIVFQIPSEALVRNKGWRSYWRMPEEH